MSIKFLILIALFSSSIITANESEAPNTPDMKIPDGYDPKFADIANTSEQEYLNSVLNDEELEEFRIDNLNTKNEMIEKDLHDDSKTFDIEAVKSFAYTYFIREDKNVIDEYNTTYLQNPDSITKDQEASVASALMVDLFIKNVFNKRTTISNQEVKDMLDFEKYEKFTTANVELVVTTLETYMPQLKERHEQEFNEYIESDKNQRIFQNFLKNHRS